MYSVQYVSDAHKCLNIAGPESEEIKESQCGRFWTQGYAHLAPREGKKKTAIWFQSERCFKTVTLYSIPPDFLENGHDASCPVLEVRRNKKIEDSFLNSTEGCCIYRQNTTSQPFVRAATPWGFLLPRRETQPCWGTDVAPPLLLQVCFHIVPYLGNLFFPK